METSVWQRIHDEMDPLAAKPEVRSDAIVRRIESGDGGGYFMAKSPTAGTYLRLSEREHGLFSLMDGTRTVKQIVLADFLVHKSLAYNRVVQLITLLHSHSFLVGRYVPTYALIRGQLRASHGVWPKAQTFVEILFGRPLGLNGIDSGITKLYRRGGWVLFAPPVLAVLAVIGVSGLAIFEEERQAAPPLSAVLSGDGWLIGGIAFALFLVGSILLHELAHALTCKRFGREVRRGGFMLFFGFPAFFVDTSDIWLEGRWRRIAVSSAGACADATLAGACALLARVLPPELAVFSLMFASMTYGIVIVNLFPLLELDGYYVLQDLLETPNLRPRSFTFLKESLARKVWRHERFTREEIILAVFGLLSAGYTAFFLYKLLHFWNSSIGGFIFEAISGGNHGSLAIAILVTVILVVAVMVKLMSLGHRAATVADRGARILIRAARQAQLRPRERLLAGLPMLGDLPTAQLDAIAAAMRSKRYRQGSTVIRQGDRGDRFFIIVRGAADVLRADPGRPDTDPAVVAMLGPGDYFGELALLNQAPRNATVRAQTSMELLELSSDDFARLVSPTWQLNQRMEHAIAQRDAVGSIPLFADLSPSERDLLMTHLVDESFEPNQLIIREGDEGDRFYVIRSGAVRVLKQAADRESNTVAELGVGDFFGEHALLFSTPRDATVQAIDRVDVWSLDRRDFDDVLRHYLRQDDALLTVARQRDDALREPLPAVTAAAS